MNAPLKSEAKTHIVLLRLYRWVLDGALGYIKFDSIAPWFAISRINSFLKVKDRLPSGETGEVHWSVVIEELSVSRSVDVILGCYEHLVSVARGWGWNVSSFQTVSYKVFKGYCPLEFKAVQPAKSRRWSKRTYLNTFSPMIPSMQLWTCTRKRRSRCVPLRYLLVLWVSKSLSVRRGNLGNERLTFFWSK